MYTIYHAIFRLQQIRRAELLQERAEEEKQKAEEERLQSYFPEELL